MLSLGAQSSPNAECRDLMVFDASCTLGWLRPSLEDSSGHPAKATPSRPECLPSLC